MILTGGLRKLLWVVGCPSPRRTEPGEFQYPGAIWGIQGTPRVMNVRLIRHSYDSDSWASRLFGRVICLLLDRGSRYWICTSSTRCSRGMGSWPMFPESWVFIYSRASRSDRPRTVYHRCFILLLRSGSSFHRLVVFRFLLILSHCWKNIKKKKLFFRKLECKTSQK